MFVFCDERFLFDLVRLEFYGPIHPVSFLRPNTHFDTYFDTCFDA